MTRPRICFFDSLSLKKVLAIKPLIIGTDALSTANTPALTERAEKANRIKGIAAENSPTNANTFQLSRMPSRFFGLIKTKTSITKPANTTRKLANANEPNSGTPIR